VLSQRTRLLRGGWPDRQELLAETRGVVLPDNTPEAIQPDLSLIDRLDLEEFHQTSSLDHEMAIIAKALAQAS
jgi:hypothetical protein